ncbi:MAG TPA: PqqD family protein [Pseudonocardia sp.]|uniref:PqqD family protein n=1 Tax=Pseudonocardia sp. TaxID=60912 RepID=UPI002D166EB4|nr:PqqD family protein [Pseudonocardia sp.]HTF54423.1 PqqD family protein [Pseudonocardia sp.]
MASVVEGHITTTTSRFEAVAGVQHVEIKDGLVLYQHEPERVHRLNRTAAVIYLLCDGSRVVDDIAEEVQLAFNASDTPSYAVIDCLRQLTEAGVIRPVDDTEDTEGQSATITSAPVETPEGGQSND